MPFSYLDLLVVALGAAVGVFLWRVVYRNQWGSSVEDIPPRPALLMLLTGCIYYAIYRAVGGPSEIFGQWAPHVLVCWIFAALLLVISFVNVIHGIIPHPVTIGGLVAGVLGSLLAPQLMGETSRWWAALYSLAGAGAGFGVLWGLLEGGKRCFPSVKFQFDQPEAWTISKPDSESPPELQVADRRIPLDEIFARESDRMIIRGTDLNINGRELGTSGLEIGPSKLRLTLADGSVENMDLDKVWTLKGRATRAVVPREALGFGVVMLVTMIGAFVGWQGMIFVVIAGSILGTIAAIILQQLLKSHWAEKIPFGPFLAAGSVIWLVRGAQILSWYMEKVNERVKSGSYWWPL
jgi:leader peptidase (prepilin peptidase)/N-methyltransferase